MILAELTAWCQEDSIKLQKSMAVAFLICTHLIEGLISPLSILGLLNKHLTKDESQPVSSKKFSELRT
jgi:hypothetical protein